MLGLFLLTACGPGSLQFDNEARVLRSAWAVEDTSAGKPILLLSTSTIPCHSEASEDPTEVLLETQEISHARSREGSLLLWATLDRSLQPGIQEVTLYGFEVTEAERMWTDGLIANYRPIETLDYVTAAAIDLRSVSETRWSGGITAEEPALKASFRAEVCESEEVFQILGLIGIE